MMFSARGIGKAKFYNENFNHFFTERLNSMTPEQRLLIPDDLDYKIFKHGNEASAEKLEHNEIIWILNVVFGQDIFVMVLDIEKGLDIDAFRLALKAQKGKLANGDLVEELDRSFTFVYGGKQLMQAISYISQVQTTGIYQLIKGYLKNADHKKNQHFVEQKSSFNKTVEFLRNYEAHKQRITRSYNLTMPEWYALLYFATKEEFAINFYQRDFLYAFNSSKMNLHKGMVRLYNHGYLSKRTAGKKDKYTISAKGQDLLYRIFNNILLKF